MNVAKDVILSPGNVEPVAKAIYYANPRRGPVWENAPQRLRRVATDQAVAAMRTFCGFDEEVPI